MTSTKHTIRIVDIRQSKRPSIIAPLAAIVLGPGALMWPGTILDSAAMQWAGFILFIIFVFGFLGRWGDSFCTPDEARQKIDEIEQLGE